jgi:hypothetical protein
MKAGKLIERTVNTVENASVNTGGGGITGRNPHDMCTIRKTIN